MAYEFELELKEMAVKALKKAHAAFMAGDPAGYAHRMREAETAIRGIEALGISADNPRYIWVERLTCDWKLVDSLQVLQKPRQLLEIYRECFYYLCPESWVLDREMPYLPQNCTDVLAFYGAPEGQEDQMAKDLEEAIDLYGHLTGGGGAGVDLLYQAEVALRRQQRHQARRMAENAQATGGAWVKAYAERILQQAVGIKCAL